VTDGPALNFWSTLDSAVTYMGFPSLLTKFHLPLLLLLPLGYLLDFVGWAVGRKFKVSVFTVKMLTIHRDFDISNARRELGYEPVVGFEEVSKLGGVFKGTRDVTRDLTRT